MKKIIFYIMTIIGLLGFFGLYILVCLVTEDEFPALRHIVMLIGYGSLGLFVGGFLPLIISKSKKEKDINVEEN